MALSVAIITYNEEKNIERCLKSVVPISDDIVVVDSFSTDNTRAICAKYNVKVVQHKFEGYGTQRQLATQHTKHTYVLSLDADEELSPELQQSILDISRNLKATCYSFDLRNHYCNQFIRYCGWYPNTKIRLYNKRELDWNTNSVHETIDTNNQHTIVHLTGYLNHYTCASISQHWEKEKKYALIAAEALAKKGKPICILLPYLKSAFKFIKIYIIKLGFLDGYYGYVISKTLAYSTFLKYQQARRILTR